MGCSAHVQAPAGLVRSCSMQFERLGWRSQSPRERTSPTVQRRHEKGITMKTILMASALAGVLGLSLFAGSASANDYRDYNDYGYRHNYDYNGYDRDPARGYYQS